MRKVIKGSYRTFLAEIKSKIRNAQYNAMKQVNLSLLKLYWDIGKSIVEKQNKYGWGKSVVETLSKDLQDEFPGVNGYSVQNLWYMRQMYLEYKGNTKLQPLVGEISWSHNLVIMSKCKANLEREFYIQMVIRYGWSKTVLIHQIEGKTYEKFLLNQTNFKKAVPRKYQNQADLAVKDEYNFDFLKIKDAYSEKELETALIKNIRDFLMELGGDFTFIANQYRLQIDGEDFYIDLLLYHRKLRSLVAIDLKTGGFKPEYMGKMNFYLAVLDDTVKQESENPSFGIIICKNKSKTIVEYALKKSKSPIGIASYKLITTLPREYKNILPSPVQIEKKLSAFFMRKTKTIKKRIQL